MPTRALDFFTNILLAGTLIFGGGPVVIPLLRGYTVDPGWVLPRDFLIGLAIQQALPGPVVNFSGRPRNTIATLGLYPDFRSSAVFLGVLAFPSQPLVGALLALLAIYVPGLVLKVGALPFYLRWRTSKTTRSILRGLNAAAIGLVRPQCVLPACDLPPEPLSEWHADSGRSTLPSTGSSASASFRPPMALTRRCRPSTSR